MTHRIDDYLDGAVDRRTLSPDERAHVDALERAIEETRAFIDERPAPDLTAAVMRSIHQGDLRTSRRPSFLARATRRVWTTREISFRFRPAYVIVAAAAVTVAAILIPVSKPRSASAPTQGRSQGSQTLLVQFRLQASEASTVQLAGSFTNWQPQYELHQSAPGIWTITLPLPLGVHDYAFVIDGQRWVPDPYAQAVDDGFGGTNSRIALLPPDHARS
ncbi:MAG TPA: glycogen-binding domain-containing protein [Vicinamibacterales bacterium]|nr:glycogen-binding domain-containing protein [Vicinamibacterales bacterium]